MFAVRSSNFLTTAVGRQLAKSVENEITKGYFRSMTSSEILFGKSQDSQDQRLSTDLPDRRSFHAALESKNRAQEKIFAEGKKALPILAIEF